MKSQPLFLCIQATYSSATIALYQGNQCLSAKSNNDTKASSHLIPLIEALLHHHSYSLQDLSFIAIDKGPGAFTSLRVAIATVNGIAFAHHIPLVGVDSLDALTHDVQETHQQHPIIVPLLNAYNNDVYYQIAEQTQQQNSIHEKGCKKIDLVLATLQETFSDRSIIVTGNGATLHQNLIKETLPATVHFYDQPTPTINAIAILALAAFNRNEPPVYKLEPLYLKSQYFAIRPKQNAKNS